MELLLNLVWCTIVGAAALRFTIWSVGKPARTRVVVALATVCILAMLFPVISMTDDLATAPAAIEAWNAMRRTALIAFVMVHLLPAAPASAFATIVAQIGRLVHLACVRLGAVTALSVLSPSISTIWSFRAPPQA